MSSDERFPYSRRAIVGVGGMGLVAAAAPAFAQSSKEPPLSKQNETSEPEGLIPAASIPSRRFVDRSSLGRGLRAGWIRAQTTARRHIAGRAGSLAGRLW
jgi:hypothetical protein